MEFQVAEAAKLIQELAAAENLTLSDALTAFVAEAELSVENAAALKGALFESYTLESMAADSLTRAMQKTFFAREEVEEIQEVQTKETAEGTKYKVRVQDKNTGSSYTRYATRAKIAELRANPNISSVELSDYGDSSEDKDGQKTAAAKRGDRAKKDYDGDGKVESSSKEHAGAVHNAIQRKMGGKPDGKDTRKESLTIEDANGNTFAEVIDIVEMPTSGTMAGNTAMNNAAEKQRMMQQEREAKKLQKAQMMQQKQDDQMLQRDIMASAEVEGEDLQELDYSAKKARKGKDIGKPGKNFAKIASSAAKRYGSKEAGERVAGAILAKQRAKFGEATLFDQYKEIREEKKKKHEEECKPCDHKEDYLPEGDLIGAGDENQVERDGKKITGKGVDNSTVVKLMPKLGEEVITEKSVSKAQQKFMGMVYATKKGDMKDGSAAVKKAAAEMSDKEAKKFASTKRKGLPDHVEDGEPKESVSLDAAGMPILKEYSRNNAQGPTVDMVKPAKDEEGEVGVKNPKGPRASRRKPAMGGDRRPGVGPGAGV